MIMFACILLVSMTRFWLLTNEYDQNVSDSDINKQDQLKKKQEAIKRRDQVRSQQKIMNYSDLTMDAFGNEFPVNEFIQTLTTIAPGDLSFKQLKLRKKSNDYTGTSSIENANATFYQFVQRMQDVDYIKDLRYSISTKEETRSSFSMSFTMKENDE